MAKKIKKILQTGGRSYEKVEFLDFDICTAYWDSYWFLSQRIQKWQKSVTLLDGSRSTNLTTRESTRSFIMKTVMIEDYAHEY